MSDRTEICSTNIFDNIRILTFYQYYAGSYECFVEVTSENPFQSDWSNRILRLNHPPRTGDLEFCLSIHSKVLKYTRKKLRSANSRLLRKDRYRKLFLAQKGKCYLCGEPLTAINCSVDHVMPISKGGSKEKENLLLAHQPCNGAKGNRLPHKEELGYLQHINDLMDKMRSEQVNV